MNRRYWLRGLLIGLAVALAHTFYFYETICASVDMSPGRTCEPEVIAEVVSFILSLAFDKMAYLYILFGIVAGALYRRIKYGKTESVSNVVSSENTKVSNLSEVLWGVAVGLPVALVGAVVGFVALGMLFFAKSAGTVFGYIGLIALVCFGVAFAITFRMVRARIQSGAEVSAVTPAGIIAMLVLLASGWLYSLNANVRQLWTPAPPPLEDIASYIPATFSELKSVGPGKYVVPVMVKENTLLCGRSAPGVSERCLEAGELLVKGPNDDGDTLSIRSGLPMGRVNDLSKGSYAFYIEKIVDTDGTVLYFVDEFEPRRPAVSSEKATIGDKATFALKKQYTDSSAMVVPNRYPERGPNYEEMSFSVPITVYVPGVYEILAEYSYNKDGWGAAFPSKTVSRYFPAGEQNISFDFSTRDSGSDYGFWAPPSVNGKVRIEISYLASREELSKMMPKPSTAFEEKAMEAFFNDEAGRLPNSVSKFVARKEINF